MIITCEILNWEHTSLHRDTGEQSEIHSLIQNSKTRSDFRMAAATSVILRTVLIISNCISIEVVESL